MPEQDNSAGPPSAPRRSRRFAFRMEPPFSLASRLFGVTADRAFVTVDDDDLRIRFGAWSLATPLDNVEHAEATGPYQWWKVIGPARLSFSDRGITFATSASGGVCIRFREPVPAILPNGLLRHPGVTVTVEDADDLVRILNRSGRP